MSGDKVSGDKTGGDKMSGDKIREVESTKYNKFMTVLQSVVKEKILMKPN